MAFLLLFSTNSRIFKAQATGIPYSLLLHYLFLLSSTSIHYSHHSPASFMLRPSFSLPSHLSSFLTSMYTLSFCSSASLAPVVFLPSHLSHSFTCSYPGTSIKNEFTSKISTCNLPLSDLHCLPFHSRVPIPVILTLQRDYFMKRNKLLSQTFLSLHLPSLYFPWSPWAQSPWCKLPNFTAIAFRWQNPTVFLFHICP